MVCLTLSASRVGDERQDVRVQRRRVVRSSSLRGAVRGRAVRGEVRCSAASEHRIIICGAPASGKGTQCEQIVAKYGLTHISAGDLLRAETQAGSEIGMEAKGYMEVGGLVPDALVVKLVKARLAQPDCAKGWLLDGYPRSKAQADALKAAGIEPNVFLNLEVPDDAIVQRVVGRRMDPETGKIYHLEFFPPPAEIVPRLTQRADDTEEACRNRLAQHAANVEAVLGSYADMCVTIDGNRAKDAVFADVCKAIDA